MLALERHLPPRLQAQLASALRLAQQQPHRRSAILGQAAMQLAAKAQEPRHAKEAPVLRALADQIAEAAMAHLPRATMDDFEEQLQEFDQAHGEFSSDIDVLARADDIHDAKKTERHGKRMSIAPLSWGAGATLGRSGVFKYGPSSDEIKSGVSQASTLAFWQGEPHETQAITVDLAPPTGGRPMPLQALPDPSGGPVEVSTRPRGLISFGADGAITEVAVDAGFGVRLTVPGNYVTVQLAMDPPRTGAVAGEMKFTGMLGAFAAPSAAPVMYTVFLDDLGDGAITDGVNGPPPIQRPSHANYILPILSTATSGNVLLSFYGQGGVQLLAQYIYPLGQILPPIPLSAQVQYIVVENGVGGVADFQIPFQLSL